MTRRSGGLEKRGENTWRLTVDIGVDPISGRRRRVTETVHGSKKFADDRMAELRGQANQGLLEADRKMTVSQLSAPVR
ncbi:MAG: hypothetical protein M0000_01585 [Actinomycetota bacterium]|nr:hypothetical protein [Actinomycetota bacterium]